MLINENYYSNLNGQDFNILNNTVNQINQQINDNNFEIEEKNLYFQQDDHFYLAEKSNDFKDISNSKIGMLLQEDVCNYLSNIELFPEELTNLIIMFDEGIMINEQLQILNVLGWEGKIIKQFNIIPAVKINVEYSELMKNIEKISNIDKIYKIFKDTTFKIENSIDNTNSNVPTTSTLNIDNWWIEAIGAINTGFDGDGVSIAILDTGITSDHIDIVEKTTNVIHKNFASGIGGSSVYNDHNAHGTHCAGIAAGTGEASNGKYRGVAPKAQLYNLKVANTSGSIAESDVISAVEWAIESGNVDILSMSFGTNYPEVYNPESAALLNATKNGIVCISSAGNSGPQFYTGGSPAAGTAVISVGAIDENMNLTSFSSYGPSDMGHVIPDILAPGSNIISTEEKDSLLSNYLRYTGSYIEGTETNSNYIPMSGTSMACPMVAGAAALILQAYPYLTPEGVRIALYKGAYPPNDVSSSETEFIGDNGIGAGIINVTASLEWLNLQTDENNITGAFPNYLPIKPYDLIKYPGDEQYTNISVFSATNQSKTLDIILPEIEGLYLSSNIDQLVFSNHSVEFFNLHIKVLENSTTGIKTGLILLNNTVTHTTEETINITIDVEYPKGRIYFESSHGLNDYSPLKQWSSGYIQIEIYESMKFLHNYGYKLDYLMDGWTYGYNSSTDAQIITQDKIELADIIILQTPVLPYTDYEIDILKEFVDNGGSILVLGTRYQCMTNETLNTLLDELNTGININQDNINNFTDIGLGYLITTYDVSDVNVSSDIFSSEDEFSFWYGPTLEIEETYPSYELASLNNKPIVGAYEGELSGKGNIVIWSDYHWLKNDIFNKDLSTKNTHENILENLIDFLNTRDSEELTIIANFNTTQTVSSSVEMNIGISNSVDNSYNDSFIPSNTINASLFNPDGTFNKNIDLKKTTSTGNYYNLSFNLDSENKDPFTIQINISGDFGLIQRNFSLFYLPDDLISFEQPFGENSINRIIGTKNSIGYINSTSVDSANLYGCLTPTSFGNQKKSNDYSMILNHTINSVSGNFTIGGNENAGRFVFFAIGNDTSGFNNFNIERDYFTIKNHNPIIDLEESYIMGISFDSTQTDDSISVLQASTGVPLSISIKVNESVQYEDSTEEFSVVLTYLAASFAHSNVWPMQPKSIPYEEFQFSPDNEEFSISFDLPESLIFKNSSGEEIEVSQKYVISEDSSLVYGTIIWVTVTDSEGGYDDYYFILMVDIPFDFLDYLPVIILFLVIIGIIIAIYGFSSRRNKIYMKEQNNRNESYYDNNIYDINESSPNQIFCHNCGNKIENGTIKCPYCGAQPLY
ncbi:MAG: S8 family serine peptidase [archaeon]|nr:S8 family serine peptidase [archaeon]